MANEDKELICTSWELFNLYSIVGSQGGKAAQMRLWWPILDALEPSDEKKLNWDG